jgi:hypothetical protein
LLVPADIGGALKLVANVSSSSRYGNGRNSHNGVGAGIVKPDFLVLDFIDYGAGSHVTATAKKVEKKKDVRFD